MLVNWVRYLELERIMNDEELALPSQNRVLKGPLREWSVSISRHIGGAGFALAYDVLSNEYSPGERAHFDTVISYIVHAVSPQVWGFLKPSTRIYSNWAGYNSDIYLMNCVLEGSSGHSALLSREYAKILRAFSQNSFYASGFTFEDGYTPSTGLREGSMGLVALARRDYNFLETPRFRKFLSYMAQSYEPWECSNFIGHASGSGGGQMYSSVLAMARYAYPAGSTPALLWRGNMGADFLCYWKIQSALAITLFGGEHMPGAASSPEGVTGMPLSAYGREGGLIIARSSLSPYALYIHFNGRHDAFFTGHSNADRGTFTLTGPENLGSRAPLARKLSCEQALHALCRRRDPE